MINPIRLMILTCFVAFGMAALPYEANAQGWGEGPVIVFDSRDGRGNASSFGVGVYRNDRGEFGSLRNDSASSVIVPAGFRVRFCENEGRNGQGDGRCEEYGPGNHNLRYSNEASYIRVLGPAGGGWGTGWGGGGRRGVTVYEGNFRGRSQTFGVGRYLNAARQLGALRNDEASSVIVGRGFRVRLCEDEGGMYGRGSGRCEEYGEGRHVLRYQDTASYIEVLPANSWGGGNWPGTWPGGVVNPPGNWPPGRPGNVPGWVDTGAAVILYSDRNQRGDQQAFSVGVYRNDQGQLSQVGNDRASSVYVAPGYRVRICESEGRNGSGRCETYRAGSYNLRYNNSASYVQVRRGN